MRRGTGAGQPCAEKISLYLDQVVNVLADVRPLGINVNFFNDTDRYLKPPRPLSAALREMGVRYLRYPGGDKSDFYLFAAPPYDHAVATPSQTEPGTNESRAHYFNADRTAYNREVLGFDDFMKVCRQAGCEPVITCAIDTYVQTKERLPGAIRVSTREDFLRNAVEWVRYANVKHHYGVKYWMLGNEIWVAYHKTAAGVPYGYPPETYAQDLVDFSAAMKAVAPTIKVITNGVDWTIRAYLPKAVDSIDAICTSNYPVRDSNPIRNYQEWVERKHKNDDLAWETEDVLKAIDAAINAAKKSRLRVIQGGQGAQQLGFAENSLDVHAPTHRKNDDLCLRPIESNDFRKGIDVFGYNYKPEEYRRFRENNPGQPLIGTETSSGYNSRGAYFFPVTPERTGGLFDFQVSSYGPQERSVSSRPKTKHPAWPANGSGRDSTIWASQRLTMQT